jgi:hypothetical protein
MHIQTELAETQPVPGWALAVVIGVALAAASCRTRVTVVGRCMSQHISICVSVVEGCVARVCGRFGWAHVGKTRNRASAGRDSIHKASVVYKAIPQEHSETPVSVGWPSQAQETV